MRFGVDVLDVDRVMALMDGHGDRLVRRVATPREADWIGRPPSADRASALIAVKEAAIKAAGGRPRGFMWTAIEVSPAALIDAERSGATALFEEFGRGVGVAEPDRVRWRWGDLTGDGCWGRADGRVFAAAVIAGGSASARTR